MRTITDHIDRLTPTAANQLTLHAADQRGDGNANHAYLIGGFDASGNASLPTVNRPADEYDLAGGMCVLFQNGPIPQHGVNGITIEVLLAICADRLRGFQTGPYPCAENGFALDHIECALEQLHVRTRERFARQVED